ncbi:TetR/AcrR family transcriptional regulator [Delftia acidovorans]|uniref:TetR/AcrR family transcriptional regulator n=1 Tax=Delftia acidovorans TaxID=80866 RepID=UPI0030190D9E
MTKTTRRPSSRDKILDAATALVTERGVQQLTIEAAAAAAGVTKAGLIYHFKTRDDLLVAVVESMARTIDLYSRAAEEQRASRVNDASRGSQSELQSAMLELVEMTFQMPPQLQRLMRNLLEAHFSHPDLLPPVQALFERSYGIASECADPGRALLISLAMDGMQLIDLLRLHQFTSEQRNAIRRTVEELISQLP